MLIRLPVNRNNRIFNNLFRVTINNNKIIVKPYDNNNFIKILLSNNLYGLYDINI